MDSIAPHGEQKLIIYVMEFEALKNVISHQNNNNAPIEFGLPEILLCKKVIFSDKKETAVNTLSVYVWRVCLYIFFKTKYKFNSCSIL